MIETPSPEKSLLNLHALIDKLEADNTTLTEKWGYLCQAYGGALLEISALQARVEKMRAALELASAWLNTHGVLEQTTVKWAIEEALNETAKVCKG